MSGSVEPRPYFQVEKQEGTFTRTVIHFEEDVKVITNSQGIERKVITRRMVPVKEEYEGRYMIYFPQGHSMCVDADDEEQLRRIGVLKPVPIVDMNSGEFIPDNFHLSNKDIVERKTKNRPRPQTGGLSDLDTEVNDNA